MRSGTEGTHTKQAIAYPRSNDSFHGKFASSVARVDLGFLTMAPIIRDVDVFHSISILYPLH